jgi:hypoxanthine phosphoribosyltransferase
MSSSTAVLGDVVVDSASIRRRVGELAAEIDRHYADIERPLVLLCVLKGSLIFTADLARALATPLQIECVALRSYGGGMTSSGDVQVTMDVTTSLADRDVLIVEDIVDSGTTITALQSHLTRLHPRSVRLVALLDKSSRRTRPVHVDWRGFDIPDRFVVGYGLDHGERYRNLVDVRALDGG